MGRRPCCSKDGLNKGAWSAQEDEVLMDYIKFHGEGKWRGLPSKAGLKRCGKSCRLRWLNYLRPDIKRGNIAHDEEELIIRLHRLLGNRWSLIAGRLPGRTDNEIKNYWNTKLVKKVQDHPKTITSSTHRHSNLSKDDDDDNEKKKKPIEPSPTPNTESRVVRPKAVRCTKVFLSPPCNNQLVEPFATSTAMDLESNDWLSSFIPEEDKVFLSPPCNNQLVEPFATSTAMDLESNDWLSSFIPEEDKVFLSPPCNNQLVEPFATSTAMDLESNDWLSSFIPEEDNSLDFMMDLNVDDFGLSYLLNSDFFQLCRYYNGLVGEISCCNDITPSSDQPLFYPDELLV
ncbi:PREDICTED: transcription factor TT2-like [Nelumbo nucifera]|uniref:Transcription factor TT2-like n=2 Tax=Nelumbo nucifera TaxID=4432 RepID=A0A1U8AC48_NELNU|nr:PREDICTED: transcription factor TT2-like [Nelumbo nucifera]DAD18457.1 TPA_asm: hypothetical protein HUJ06_019920 [Nelumbo nucifera]